MHARRTALELLHARSADATVCPSEVARALADADATTDWRSLMPAVHAAVDELLANGSIRLTWKGKRLDRRSGPYRINRR